MSSSKESVTFLNQQQKAIKIIVVGDGYIGKTCLLSTYVFKKFPHGYAPTIFENHSGKLNIFYYKTKATRSTRLKEICSLFFIRNYYNSIFKISCSSQL